MGIGVEVNVDLDDLERLEQALKDGVEDGARDTADWAVDEGKNKAQDIIRIGHRGHPRIWTSMTYNSFSKVIYDDPGYGTNARLINTSPHAHIVEDGRRPGARAPQVQDIIEWVIAKLDPAPIHDSDDEPDLYNEGHGIINDNVSITEVEDGKSAGLADSVNEGDIRKVHYDNGDAGIFKPNEVTHSEPGVVQNEEVVHRIAEEMGWADEPGFPISRQRTITDIDGQDKTGNIMGWVNNPDPIGDTVRTYYDPHGEGPEKFANRNKDFSARIAVLDYIVGNSDRHTGNILIDGDGVPWAIDSGGHGPPVMNNERQRLARLLALDSFKQFDLKNPSSGDYIVDDPDELLDAMEDIFNRQEWMFRRLSDNPELREDIIEMAEALHSDGTSWTDHYEKLLSDDSTWRYALFVEKDEWGDKELWKHDLDLQRELIRQEYEKRTGDDPGELTFPDDYTVDDKLDEIIGTDNDGN